MDEFNNIQFGSPNIAISMSMNASFLFKELAGRSGLSQGAAVSKCKYSTSRWIQDTILIVCLGDDSTSCIEIVGYKSTCRRGWKICSHERLRMKVVDRMESPLHGSIPASRVLQNQLDHLLESEIVETERHLLMNVQKVIQASGRTSWVATFLATTILLHVKEQGDCCTGSTTRNR